MSHSLTNLRDNGFDLSLTGFQPDELVDLFNDSEDNEDLFKPPKEEKYNSVFELVIECQTELEQEKLYKEMSQKGYKCRILSM